MSKVSRYCLGFQLLDGIGPKSFDLIVSHFGSVKAAWEGSRRKWAKIPLPAKTKNEFFEHRLQFDLEVEWNKLKASEIWYLGKYDPQFPGLLKQIPDCPIGLFVRGEVSALSGRMLSVVGSRRVTRYGRLVTKNLVAGLVRAGFRVVSGLALGVDGLAHQETLNSGGVTVAVLGSGVDEIQPRTNLKLAEAILARGGAIVSEYPPGTIARAGFFPMRNRIVAGLSEGVLVIEGAKRSGSLITSLLGLDYNREVFAVPGEITNQLSQAPHFLIRQGATLVRDVQDIFSQLAPLEGEVYENKALQISDQVQQQIWDALREGSLSVDELVVKLGVDAATVLSGLSILEVGGYLEEVGEGRYVANATHV
jgi:DNA processing protein